MYAYQQCDQIVPNFTICEKIIRNFFLTMKGAEESSLLAEKKWVVRSIPARTEGCGFKNNIRRAQYWLIFKHSGHTAA
jgi:hypothetical protein